MDNIDYILTNHAKQRMRARGVSEEEVDMTLNNPEYSSPGKQGEKNHIKTFPSGKKIRVVFRLERKKAIVMTVVIIE